MNQKGISIILVLMAMLALAVIGTVIFSITATETVISAKTAASTQAFYVAESGIQYALAQMRTNFETFTGVSDKPAGNGTFSVAVYTTDESGTALLASRRRVKSTGMVGDSKRVIQVMLSNQPPSFSFGCYISRSDAPTGILQIYNSTTINGNFYIGADVNVRPGAVLGNLVPTLVCVPVGHVVTGYGNWAVHPNPQPVLQPLDTKFYDQKIAIAETIPSGNNNSAFLAGTSPYYYGNLTISNPLDLKKPGYADTTEGGYTIYIKGSLVINGATVYCGSMAGDKANPARIVVAGSTVNEIKGNAALGNNLVIISQSDLSIIGTNTQVGTTTTGVVNEIYSRTNVSMSGGQIYSNIFSSGDISVRTMVRGAVQSMYAAEFESGDFAGTLQSASIKLDRITNSAISFSGTLPSSSTGATKASVMPGSWKEII